MDVRSEPDGWSSTGLAYYPLWRAERNGRALATRRGDLGDLQVEAGGEAGSVRLVYVPGWIEHMALLVSAVVLVGAAASALREVAAGRDAQRRAERVGSIEDPRLQR
jgi:hypothetical protein